MMSAFETFLARLQFDPVAREAFRRDRRAEGAQAGLAETDLVALESVDLDGLEAAAQQLAYRRALAIRFAGASRSCWRHRQLVQRRRR
jgi:hypothetical protein